MAKRKIDCDVDDFIVEYLKKAKFEKTLSEYEKERRESDSKSAKSLAKFYEYLKTSRINQEIDDLGFEINFGAYQPTKIPILNANKSVDKIKGRNKKMKIKRKLVSQKNF